MNDFGPNQYDLSTVTREEFFKDGYRFGNLVHDFCFHDARDPLRFGQWVMNNFVKTEKSCAEIYYETDDLIVFQKLCEVFQR